MLTFKFRRSIVPTLIVLALILLGGASACGDSMPRQAAAAPAGETAPPTRSSEKIMVIVDLSSSITPGELAQHRQLLSKIVQDLSFGDQLVIQVAHARGVTNGKPPVVAEMPGSRNPLRPLPKETMALKIAKKVAIQSVNDAIESGGVPSTDLLATLHSAANQLDGADRPIRSLVILSDMLQCASGLCLESPGSHVPGADWIGKQAAEGTLPDLQGVCITAAGPDPSTPHGVQVRKFWEAYFAATGAKLNRYQHEIPSVTLLHCS